MWSRVRGGRRRGRTIVIGGLLLLLSVAMLVVAGSAGGFTGDLLLNLGSSLVLAAVSYLIFDPIFDEARKARVQEHDHFDQAGFVDRIRETDRSIRILDTWTLLLDARNRERTFEALRGALEQGATIRVLLLDPDSSAAQQRAEELERRQIDVAAQIMDNLRLLYLFREGLKSAELGSRLRVYVYDASPSIQLYQWDDRALISFFPIGKVSFDVPQLEVDMASPWGQFVDRRFDELWDDPDHIRSLDRYWLLSVTVIEAGALDTVSLPYVGTEDEIYVDGSGNLAKRMAAGRQTKAPPVGAQAVWPPRRSSQEARPFDLIPLDNDHTPEALSLFDRKYGDYPRSRAGEIFLLRLVPRS